MPIQTAFHHILTESCANVGLVSRARTIALGRRFLATDIDLRINGDRLNRTLHETCEFGTGSRYGP